MGLFSSKKKIHVSASSSKMMEDAPEIIRQSIRTSLLNPEGDLVPDLINNGMNGSAVKARQAYNYGRTKYVYGLPEGTIEAAQADDASIRSAIQLETGKNVYIVVNVRGKTNIQFWAYEFLEANRGWNQETDIVTAPPEHTDKEVFFEDVDAFEDNKLVLQYYYMTTPTAPELPKKVLFSETVTTISPMKLDKNYFHCIYRERTQTEVLPQDYYWFYEQGTGKYPELDENRGIDQGSPYFPIVPLRVDNRDVLADDTTELYKTAKFYLNKFNMKIEQLRDSINDNPDVGEVDFAFVVLGVHIADKNPIVHRYLFEHFAHLWEQSLISSSDWDNWVKQHESGVTALPAYNSVRIKDANLDWEISYSSISREIKEGVLTIHDTNFAKPKDRDANVGEATAHKQAGTHYEIFGQTFNSDALVLRKQISKTQYEELQVIGLTHTSWVYQGKSVQQTLGSAFSEEDNQGFIIPINYNVFNQLGMFKGHDLINHSFRGVFNSYKIEKIKWYQQGIFKVVMVIIAVAVAYFTGQWQVVAAAYASGGMVAVAVLVAQFVAVSTAVNVALTAIARIVSPELAMLLAAVAIVAGMSGKLPFGADALDAAMLGNKLVQKSINYGLQGLMSDYQEFGEQTETLMEELEELQEEMYEPDFDIMNLINSDIRTTVYPETWDRYYMRTINLAATTSAIPKSIGQYADYMTEPPSYNEVINLNKRT